MASVTEPRTRDLTDSLIRVRHPLQRLRGYIRFYVAVEAVTVFLLFAALWFWVGLALDYGIFQLSRQETFFRIFKSAPIDWVEITPVALRTFGFGVLSVALLGLLVWKVVRLFRQFRDDALALVLERRFPKLLGDRLITAVELADVRKAARYGYSQEMIEETIREAANRVDQVPLGEVFNWRRLINQVIAIAILFIGVYLVVGAAATGIDFYSNRDKMTALGGFGRFHKVATRWFERNAEPWTPKQVVRWDRMAYLEVDFPDKHDGNANPNDLRVGLDSTVAPKIHVRAYRWVGADPAVDAGWSPLRWADLARPEYKAILGSEPPALPGAITALKPPETAWTVDAVELTLNSTPVQQKLNLLPTVDKLDTIVAEHANLVHQKVGGPEGGGIGFAIKENGPDGKESTRPLKWADLRVIDSTIPDVPPGWEPEVDAVVRRLEAERVKDVAALQKTVLDRLDAAAGDGAHDRQLRKLTIPATVYVLAAGATTRNDMSLDKQGENEYNGVFQDLKETIRFSVRGEDYFTDPKTITLVPPPSLEALTSNQWRPAYAYYGLPTGATAEDFRNRKQVFPNRPLPVIGSDSRLEVPAGTDVELIATVDKTLCAVPTEPTATNTEEREKQEKVRDALRAKQPHILPPRKGVAEVKADVVRVDDKHFKCQFNNVTTALDFYFEFTDSDDVTGVRHVKILPQEDKLPDVDVNVEVIRKTTQGYLVTPKAWIPFSGKLSDDHGLTQVEYAFTVTRLDASLDNTDRRERLISAIYQAMGGLGGDLPAAAKLSLFLKDPKIKDNPAEQTILRYPLPAFAKKMQARPALALDTVLPLLTQDPVPPHPAAVGGRLLREFALEPNLGPKDEAFVLDDGYKLDLRKLDNPLEVRDPKEIQPRYRMQLWMEAVDNDLLTGPKRAPNKEKFTFLVVSENELLSEVGKEEEGLHVKLDDVTTRLREEQSRLEKVISDLGSVGSPARKADEFAPLSVTSEKALELLEKSLESTREVLNDYEKIVTEMKMNRVRDDYVNHTQNNVVTPLARITFPIGPFSEASESLKELRKNLDNGELDLPTRSDNSRKAAAVARAKLEELIKQLDGVLAGMEGIITLNKIIETARQIEEAQRAQADFLKRVKDQMEKEAYEKLFGPKGDIKDNPKDKPKDKPPQP
jgi:hypothetical protein